MFGRGTRGTRRLLKACKQEVKNVDSEDAGQVRADMMHQNAKMFCLLIACAAFRDHERLKRNAEDGEAQTVPTIEYYAQQTTSAVMPFAWKLGAMIQQQSDTDSD